MLNKAIKLLFILIVFSALFIPGASYAQEEESPENAVRKRVKEKIQEVLNKPKAYLGTITDKTDNTLQIKNIKGEIQFISVTPEKASFASNGKTTKTISYDDVALGDFIVAMGFPENQNSENKTNGNSVLEAKRVLVTEEISPLTRKIILGKVVNIQSRVLSLESGGEESQFDFPRTWKGPEINEISENDRVFVVSVASEGKNIIRTIGVINNSPTPEKE